MASIQAFIKKLQEKPPEVRQRILLVSTIVAGGIVLTIWIVGFKQEFANLNKQSILGSNTETSQVSTQHYTNVDGAEVKDGKLLIYFSGKNDTSDILNFSQSDSITLTVGDKTYKPSKITDRQGRDFVQKILSNTQSFGILTFDLKDAKTAKISFDQLHFENTAQNIFKEEINLDISKLGKPKEVRN